MEKTYYFTIIRLTNNDYILLTIGRVGLRDEAPLFCLYFLCFAPLGVKTSLLLRLDNF